MRNDSPPADGRLAEIESEFADLAGGAAMVDAATAAGILGVHPETIRRRIAHGELPASRHGAGRGILRIRIRDLARMHRAGEMRATSGAAASATTEM
jgi:hypothetical protein